MRSSGNQCRSEKRSKHGGATERHTVSAANFSIAQKRCFSISAPLAYLGVHADFPQCAESWLKAFAPQSIRAKKGLPYKQDVAGSKPASGIATICSTCCRRLFSMPVNEASTRSHFPP